MRVEVEDSTALHSPASVTSVTSAELPAVCPHMPGSYCCCWPGDQFLISLVFSWWQILDIIKDISEVWGITKFYLALKVTILGEIVILYYNTWHGMADYLLSKMAGWTVNTCRFRLTKIIIGSIIVNVTNVRAGGCSVLNWAKNMTLEEVSVRIQPRLPWTPSRRRTWTAGSPQKGWHVPGINSFL